MNPALAAIIVSLIEQLIIEEPAIAADLQKLFASGNPTPADFAALRAAVAAESYGSFVPNSQLPPAETGQ